MFADRTGKRVPQVTFHTQVFINGAHVGGSDKLAEWLARR